jgi:nitrogen-specific signal transduction histidine kinase
MHIHVKRAHELRAQATAALFRRLGSWLVSAVRRGKRPQAEASASAAECYAGSYSGVEDQLKAPLASMRSAAEILRNNQELPVEERNRFLDVVLQDNYRLEKVVDGLLRILQARAEHDHRLMRHQERLERPAA